MRMTPFPFDPGLLNASQAVCDLIYHKTPLLMRQRKRDVELQMVLVCFFGREPLHSNSGPVCLLGRSNENSSFEHCQVNSGILFAFT